MYVDFNFFNMFFVLCAILYHCMLCLNNSNLKFYLCTFSLENFKVKKIVSEEIAFFKIFYALFSLFRISHFPLEKDEYRLLGTFTTHFFNRYNL